jgi:ribose/xylose/arabinose/galactoside ABC-type transport system permease subunit
VTNPSATTATAQDRSLPLGALTSSRQRLVQWLNFFGTALAMLAVFAYFCIRAPNSFPTFNNIENILRQVMMVGIASMGATLIIIAGGIDLSVGSVMSLTTMIIALMLKRGYGPWTAAFAGVGAGCLCGLLNGTLIVSLRVVPFIITLGTMSIFRGLSKQTNDGMPLEVNPRGINQLSAMLGPDQRWRLFPSGVWIMFGCVAFAALVLRYTRFGRHVVAIGSNEQTARLCGVPVARAKLIVYTLGGLFAGVAGLMQFARLTKGDPTVAVGKELEVIAAAVIGGASLSGGQGNPISTLMGALIIYILDAGGGHLGWGNQQQDIVAGIFIIVAVALDRLRQQSASALAD